MCALSSRNTQFVPRGQAVQQAARAQEVDVGERAEEEQPLDAGGEADEVEQELPPLLARLEPVAGRWIESIQRRQNSALRADRRDVLDRGEGAGARSSGSGT